jgi:Fe-S cluster assembly iron-binding protein IscA
MGTIGIGGAKIDRCGGREAKHYCVGGPLPWRQTVGKGGIVAIQVTEEAIEVLRRSLELGNVDPKSGGVRLRGARGLGGGIDVQVELADGPLGDEAIVEREGVRIFVDPSVTEAFPEAVVAIEPQHETVVVRPTS